MSINKLKVQILESVGNLDHLQSEQVLNFIRQVLKSRQDSEDYLNFKRRAMEEIQIAIDKNRGPQLA
jgi:hypothetical protein